MKALSIRQPWARLIVLGWKDIENRSWPIGHQRNDPAHLPIRIYVHASKTLAKYPRNYTDLEEITQGEIRIGERVVNNVAPKDRDIAMVFQNYALYPHMTVYKNMAFGLKMRRVPRDEIQRKVHGAAELLGMTYDQFRHYYRKFNLSEELGNDNEDASRDL